MVAEQLNAYAIAQPSILTGWDGVVTFVRARFPSFAGDVDPGPGIRIGLNLGGGGRLRSEGGAGVFEGTWTRGKIVVSLEEPAFVRSPSVDMLGVRIDLVGWNALGQRTLAKSDFTRASREFRTDPVSASVLHAVWQAANEHGATTQFVEHGIDLLLTRLAGRQHDASTKRTGRGLPRRSLARVTEYLSGNLGRDLRLADLASIADMEATSFARAFKQATDLTPFAYVRQLRMEQAKLLLRKGLSVTEVALSLGYANPSKFAAAFRGMTGMTPREWSKAN